MGTTQRSVTLTLTERAGEEVKKFLAEEKVSPELAGLRVAVLPGGCSGFDEFSSQYLNGTVIDYKSNFQESGFAFENPNASGGCGCGSSFTV
jgi:Fe-S cluster assembly iron-binding protein IscA